MHGQAVLPGCIPCFLGRHPPERRKQIVVIRFSDLANTTVWFIRAQAPIGLGVCGRGCHPGAELYANGVVRRSTGRQLRQRLRCRLPEPSSMRAP